MQVPQIDLVHPESLERPLTSFAGPLRAAVDLTVAVWGRSTEFGGQKDFTALSGLLEPSTAQKKTFV